MAVGLTGGLFLFLLRATLREQIGEDALDLARAVARIPAIHTAMAGPDPAQVIQPLAKDIHLTAGGHPRAGAGGGRPGGHDLQRWLQHQGTRPGRGFGPGQAPGAAGRRRPPGGFCFLGVWAGGTSTFDVTLLALFGVAGYFARLLAFPPAPLLLALVLGDLLEQALRQSVTLSGANPAIFIARPTALGLLLLAALSVVYPLLRARRRAPGAPA